MPDLNEIISNRKKKKFVKKEYRPWDLGGEYNDPKASSHGIDTEKQNKTPNETDNNIFYADENIIVAEKRNHIKSSNNSPIELNNGSIKVQSGSHKGQQGFNKGSSRVQNKHVTNLLYEKEGETSSIKLAIARLGGNEKKIFFFIMQLCTLKESLSTGEMLSYEFDMELGLPRNSRETAIKRLVSKQLIVREKGKRGRHGTLILSIPSLVKKEAENYVEFDSPRYALGVQTKVKQEFNQESYNSSSNNITTTNLPEEWKNINIEALREIGFSNTQLKQLYTTAANSPDVIQESIYHFAYGLEHNKKFKTYTNPLNVLMGVLRKGQAWFENNYQSPQEMAQRQLIEKKKTERERLKKLADEAYELAFEEWRATLSQAQLEEIAPTKKVQGDVMPQKVKLTLYFRDQIWPDKQKEYLTEND